MHVESFDSLGDMFARMDELTTAANERLTPGQVMLRDNDGNTVYWAQACPDMDLVVYGATSPVSVAQRTASFDVAENRKRGFLTGIAYSALTGPSNGEYGDTHVSQVVPINRETFEAAQALDCPSWSMLREPECADLARALARFERFSQMGIPVQ
jgi:hypothetical protein